MLEIINRRLGDTEECRSDMEDRIMEITQSAQWKQTKYFKIRIFKGPLEQHQVY